MMNAVVPYVRRAVVRTYRPSGMLAGGKRRKFPYRTISNIYKNRFALRRGFRNFAWAAKGVKLMMGNRKYRLPVARAVRNRVGERIGNVSTNSSQISNEVAAWATNTLWTFPMLANIAQGTAQNQRQTNRINLRGIKFCFEFLNNTSSPIYVNLALLSPTEGRTIELGNFFRDYSANNNIGFDSAVLSSLQKYCRPINKDAYNILFHKRFLLSTRSGATYTDAGQANYRNMDFWIPIKRQFGYGAISNQANDELFLCMWCNVMQRPAPIVSVPAAITWTRDAILYWNNDQN